jgi:manganese/iron transport system ATP-binding protein/manganese/zinc/iron transport system ATP- binding protein
MALLTLDGVTKRFGGFTALNTVDLELYPNERLGLIGPNGSGKSTLIKAILGILRPDFGQVRLFGEPAERAKGRVAYVPQRGATKTTGMPSWMRAMGPCFISAAGRPSA